MDEYIFPVLLNYNREFLYETCKDLVHWPEYTNDRGKTFFSTHKDILFPINIEAIKIKNTLLESTTFSFSFVPPGHETGWHSDYTRGCTLIVPIDTHPHLIQIDIDGKVVDYFYDSPVLTNAKSFHNGVNKSTYNRYNLLFHFDKSYEEIKQLVNEDKLVTIWKQDYNIFSNINIDMIDRYFDTHDDINSSKIIITSDKNLAMATNDKFVIFLGQEVLGNTAILISKNTKNKDILNSIKFVLDNPMILKSIDIR
jgi:hypothetical protein